ncbi:hypothetical protein ROZALSC1DRAFT_25396 [Rozella allomycis CSF55]|nr:hypothetical protein ROZALSC1DRAFT_25396 [Rozella allomycis CSF55]
MACGCGLKVRLTDLVPGTATTWVSMIQSAVVFPSGRAYEDKQSFIFPMFVVKPSKFLEVNELLSTTIPGVDVTKCFFDYSKWINNTAKGLHAIGIWWEDVVVNSLAVKYYLVKLSKERIRLSDLYDFENNTYIDIVIDLGKEIVLNAVEMDVNDLVEYAALFHQKKIKKARYDFLCPQLRGQKFGLLPAQCKNTLIMSNNSTLANQLEDYEHLLWIYPGYKSGDENGLVDSKSILVKEAVNKQKIIFLNGYGCCCTLTVDMIILLKNAFKQ